MYNTFPIVNNNDMKKRPNFIFGENIDEREIRDKGVNANIDIKSEE